MITLGMVFRSGANHAGEITGTLRSGWHVGVSVSEVNSAAVAELVKQAPLHQDRLLFVDSGAFGEVEWNQSALGFDVKAPITDSDWRERIDIYECAALAWGNRCLLVCPDRVGDQSITLQRMRTHAARLTTLSDKTGAWLMLPLQQGQQSMTDFARDAYAIHSSHSRVIWGIPSKKAATTPQALSKFAKDLADSNFRAAWFHLLGCTPTIAEWPGHRFLSLVHAIWSNLPDAVITCDSVRIRALVGRSNGAGGAANILTKAQDEARASGLTSVYDVKAAAIEKVFRQEALDFQQHATAHAARYPWPMNLIHCLNTQDSRAANQLSLFT